MFILFKNYLTLYKFTPETEFVKITDANAIVFEQKGTNNCNLKLNCDTEEEALKIMKAIIAEIQNPTINLNMLEIE
jgi:hypothetical protein